MSREWDAAAYDRVAAPQARWGARVVERLELAGDETVLDAGCGSGRVTERLAERLPLGRVVAVDGSAAMLTEARSRLARFGDRVSFVHTDLLELARADMPGGAPVDAVLSTATFHLVPDHPRLFRALASVTRPGAQLAAQCGGEGNLASLLDTLEQLGLDSTGRREYASPAETAARLSAAGFDDVRCWLSEEPTPFADTAQLRDFLENVCLREPLAALGPHQREDFLDTVVAAMPARTLDYVRLNISARRGADHPSP